MAADQADLLIPPRIDNAAEWANKNRLLPEGSAEPGPYRWQRTPWVWYAAEAYQDPRYDRVVKVWGSQVGKTECEFNVIGQRLDQDPAPCIFLGPTKEFVTEQAEPRLMAMVNSAPGLSKKLQRGKEEKKTKKIFAGVQFRFAWAGSTTQMASSPAALAVVDEVDRMEIDVKGEGNPVELLEARGDTYADFTMGISSSPTLGNVETCIHPETGLEHWEVPEGPGDIQSSIWQLFNEGTRHEFMWPCPMCEVFFAPRFKHLKWKKKASPIEALDHAWLECPHCGGVIEDHHKPDMNRHGRPVAPGQNVKNGVVVGEAPVSTTYSLWVSGLCSPWKTFGERAARWIKAARSRDASRIQPVLNTAFGELYSEGGREPMPWKEIAARREGYSFLEVPDAVQVLTCFIDVQKDRLYYVIRGWGPNWESWLIDAGEKFGETHLPEVWQQARKLITEPIGDHSIALTLVDSGFRPGKPLVHPENAIYDFCRSTAGLALPTKGRDTMDRNYYAKWIDMTRKGKVIRRGVQLWHLNTDYFKSWVQARMQWEEGEAGYWHISKDASNDYCQHLASEERKIKANGKIVWVKVRSRRNDYFDCEAGNAAAAHILGLGRLRPPDPSGKDPRIERAKEMARKMSGK